MLFEIILNNLNIILSPLFRVCPHSQVQSSGKRESSLSLSQKGFFYWILEKKNKFKCRLTSDLFDKKTESEFCVLRRRKYYNVGHWEHQLGDRISSRVDATYKRLLEPAKSLGRFERHRLVTSCVTN